MCFSAPASFTSAAILMAAGIASIRLTRRKREIPLALIPFLFGLQQFSEGWLWVLLGRGVESGASLQAATWGFLFFAFLVWPFWTPFSVLLIERQRWRQVILGLLFLIGTFVSFEHLMYAMQYTPSAKIVGNSIQYQGNVPNFRILYALSVTAPCLFSSWPWMWLFGVLVASAFVVADFVFNYAFVSVWCFFSALVSALIWITLKYRPDGSYVSKN